MKRHGAGSLGEGGPCVGRPTPLRFGPTEGEGGVVEETQVVDFQDFSGSMEKLLKNVFFYCATHGSVVSKQGKFLMIERF
ncbi:MAG TPA: hypothetical protein VGR14_05685 [Verrucomicrobiae bacterium]|nr:hypothetical protein [Verrucomicrobiae bacterium]